MLATVCELVQENHAKKYRCYFTDREAGIITNQASSQTIQTELDTCGWSNTKLSSYLHEMFLWPAHIYTQMYIYDTCHIQVQREPTRG